MGEKKATTFDCHRKSMESWVGTENLVFYKGHNAPTLFRNLQRGLWHAGRVTLSKNVTPYDPRSGFLDYNMTPPTPNLHRECSLYPPSGHVLS